jgi:hypothetical protein
MAAPISCGMRSGCQNTVDPHSEQKWKITSFPVSELRVKVFEAPSTTVTALRSKQAPMLNKLPVRRRQSRQWHIETRVGSPWQLSRSLPAGETGETFGDATCTPYRSPRGPAGRQRVDTCHGGWFSASPELGPGQFAQADADWAIEGC